MPYLTSPTEHLREARRRTVAASDGIAECLSVEAGYALLAQEAEGILAHLRLAADCLRRACSAAEADEALKRADARDVAA